MGRTLFISKETLDDLSKHIQDATFECGLLIGQHCESSSNKSAHVVHWCPVPAADDGGAEALPVAAKDIDAEMVAHHASQVLRMLPGGVTVLGVYVADAKGNTSTNNHIRALLCSLYRVSLAATLNIKPLTDKMMLLAFSSKTLKYTCQSFSGSTSSALPENINVEVESDECKWLETQFTYDVDLSLHLPPSGRKTDTQSSQQAAVLGELRSWAERFANNSCFIVNGQLCKGSENSTSLQQYLYKNGDDCSPALECSILERCCSDDNSQKSAIVDDVIASVAIKGSMIGTAFLHPKCSSVELVTALKMDVCRSLYARWSLYCDSCTDEEQDQPTTVKGTQLLTLPRRAIVSVPSLPMNLCDYLFSADTADDACQSLAEILNVNVTTDSVDTGAETWPDISEYRSSTAASKASHQSVSGSALTSQYQLAALAVLFLAVILAYFIINR